MIGDKTYGKPALDKRLDPIPARQMLHAWRLKLLHPVRRVEMAFEAPIPPDMNVYLGVEIGVFASIGCTRKFQLD